jgi:hypothetical protein
MERHIVTSVAEVMAVTVAQVDLEQQMDLTPELLLVAEEVVEALETAHQETVAMVVTVVTALSLFGY